MADKTFRLAGVMGWPVGHSRSPLLHKHWLQQYGLNGAYVLLPVQPARLADAVRGLSALGFAGCNITVPHKVDAMALVDSVTPMARKIGTINTIIVQPDGSLHGVNNDGFGYIASLREAQPGWRADAGPVTVLGAGGAARAVLVALAEQGAKDVRLLNRTDAKAAALAAEFGAPVSALPWSTRHEALADAAMLVNTTTQGMHGTPALDLDLGPLPRQALVSDVVYVPLETPLLAQARARGNPTVDGLGMLMHQARPAFEAWFGVMPDITPELRRLMEASIQA